MEYTEIAYKIVNYILDLRPGQSVTISSEIHNVIDNNEPLAEIPFLEEIALVVRKQKGLPILDISTENLHKRFFEEITDDPPSISKELLRIWLSSTDMFIDLGWRSNPSFYKSIPERSFKKLDIYNIDFREIFEVSKKKLVLLGFPTLDLAKFLEIDHFLLKKTYFAALNVNYYDMKKRCLILDDKLKKHTDWQLVTENNTLHIELEPTSKCLYGEMQNDYIITLPTGAWVASLDTASLNGSMYCDQIYHEQYLWRNIKIVIENGKVISVDTELNQKNLNLLKTLLFDDIEGIGICVGLNHSIKERSFYHLFDSVKYKNVSLEFKSQRGKLVALSEIASLHHDYEKNILDEV